MQPRYTVMPARAPEGYKTGDGRSVRFENPHAKLRKGARCICVLNGHNKTMANAAQKMYNKNRTTHGAALSRLRAGRRRRAAAAAR